MANFLASLHSITLRINSYRSAISSVHEKVDGVSVGQHPTVTRLLKGVFHDRPPFPRYSSTWNVQLVLDFLGALGKNEDLTLKHLPYNFYPRSEAAATNCFTLQIKEATIRGRLLNEGGDYYYN